MNKQLWDEHVERYRVSGQSAMAYAKANGLVYHQLLYRLRQSEKNQTPSRDFLPVSVGRTLSSGQRLGVIAFPSGVRVEVHDVSLLSLLREWVVGSR